MGKRTFSHADPVSEKPLELALTSLKHAKTGGRLCLKEHAQVLLEMIRAHEVSENADQSVLPLAEKLAEHLTANSLHLSQLAGFYLP